MAQNKNQNIIYLDANNLHRYAMYEFLLTIDPKKFELNKYTSNSSKGCLLEVNLEYPKQLRELSNDCPSARENRDHKRNVV